MSKPIVRSAVVIALLAAAAGASWHFYGNDKPAVTVVDQPHTERSAEVVEQMVERETEILKPDDKTTTTTTEADLAFFATPEGRKTTRQLLIADLREEVETWVEKSGGWYKFLSQTETEQKILVDRICRKYPVSVDAQYKLIKAVYFEARINRARALMAKYTANENDPQIASAIATELKILNSEAGRGTSAFARNAMAAFHGTVRISPHQILDDSRYSDNSMKSAAMESVANTIFSNDGLKGLGEVTEAEKKLFDDAGGGKDGFYAIVESRINAIYEKAISVAKIHGVAAGKPEVTEENKDQSVFARYYTWHGELRKRIVAATEKTAGEAAAKREDARKSVAAAEKKAVEKFKTDFEKVDYHKWQLDTIKHEGVEVKIPKPKTNFSGFVGWYLWYLQNHVGPAKLAKLDPKSPEYEETETLYLRFDKDQRYKSRVAALFELRADQMAKVKAAHDANRKKLSAALKEFRQKLKTEGIAKVEKAGAHDAFVETDFRAFRSQVEAMQKIVGECDRKSNKIGNHAFETLRKSLKVRLEAVSRNLSSLCPNMAEIGDIRDELNRNATELKDRNK